MCGENNLQITATEILEVIVDDITKNEFVFPQNVSTVERGEIVAIAAQNVAGLTVSPTGKTVINAAVFNKSYLVLRNKQTGRDDINKLPLRDLLRSSNNGEWIRLERDKYDFSQSKIVVPTTAGLALNEVFIIQVIYIPESKLACRK
jgi:hypothetical protein